MIHDIFEADRFTSDFCLAIMMLAMITFLLLT